MLGIIDKEIIMSKEANFEKEIIEAMRKWGFKAEGIQKLSIEGEVTKPTIVKVEYLLPLEY
jgi:hypothetical protein